MSPTDAPAFHTRVLPSRPRGGPRGSSSLAPRCACRGASHMPRRGLLRTALALPLLPLLPSLPSLPTLAAPPQPSSPPTALEAAATPVVMCRRVMVPVQRYIEEGAWDKGRTNVNYCTRVLALRRNMIRVADLLEGDAYFDAMEIMAELQNIMTQLDASLYTPLFIPSDEGISLEQKKYQTEAFAFNAQALAYLDSFLDALPKDVLDRARTTAEGAEYEIKVESE